jgi:hypothetical protein
MRVEALTALRVGVAGSKWVGLAVVEESGGAYRVLYLERVKPEDVGAAAASIRAKWGGRYEAIGAWSTAELRATVEDALGVSALCALLPASVRLPGRTEAGPYLRELLEAGRLTFDLGLGAEIEAELWGQLDPDESDLDAIAHGELVTAVALASGLVQVEE